MEILKVRVDGIGLAESRLKVRNFLLSDGQYRIFTPNPEMLVKAQKDEYFRNVLNSGDLNICDGFGIWLVTKLKELASDDCCSTGDSFERITGVDFMLEICKIAEETDKGIYLLGSGSDEVVKKTADNLLKQLPKLKILGANKGPIIEEKDGEIEADDEDVINIINKVKPDIIFVAFGMGKQEKWIHEDLAKMPSVKIAMGVGGAFDYISGTVKRAPCWMRKIGLEWVYRLYEQPQRFSRIFNATIKFVFLVIILMNYGKKSGK